MCTLQKNWQEARGYIRFFGDKHSKQTLQIHPCPMNFDIHIQSHHFDQLQKKTSTKSMNAFTTQFPGHQPLRLTQFQQNGLKATAGIGSGFSGGVSPPTTTRFGWWCTVQAPNVSEGGHSNKHLQGQPMGHIWTTNSVPTPNTSGSSAASPKHVKFKNDLQKALTHQLVIFNLCFFLKTPVKFCCNNTVSFYVREKTQMTKCWWR